jgi:uncharacterized protein (TIGR01777 family)
MKVGVTGASGFIGTALQPALRKARHDVVRFVRRNPTGTERQWDARHLAPDVVGDLDAVIHLSGAGVAGKRWSTAYKKEILDSRVVSTHAVAEAVAQAGVPVLLSASAIGFYGGSRGSGQSGGSRGSGQSSDQILDETASVGTGFLADVVRQWEAATAPADRNARVVHLRSGVVQSREGGALATQLPLFKAGLGAPLGSGRQWVSWISLQDEVAAIVHLLSADVSGPVNLVGPEPVTNRAYTQALGRALHRPTLPVGVPAPVLRIALGEFAGEVLGGQRLVPRVLVGSGFAFAHEDLASALRSALG